MQALSQSAPGASSAQAKAQQRHQQRQQPMRRASMQVSTAASACSPRRGHAAIAAASPSALRAPAVQRRKQQQQQQQLQQRQEQLLVALAGPPHCRGRPAAAARRSVAASAATINGGTPTVAPGSVSVVLLAGGVGKRMGANIPKQYLKLRGLEIAAYSLKTFVGMPEVGEVVVVCDPSWRDVFERALEGGSSMPIKWALPGKERQDSVFNGLQEIQAGAALIAVHDSARPLVTAADALKCFKDAAEVGAAVLGAPCKPTIKEVDAANNVVKTLKRSDLWEVFTPQVIQPQLLRDGFALVRAEGLEVTDDVSIIEAMGRPVRVTPGAYTNIKVTTPDDLLVAEKFLDELQAAEAVRA